MKLTDFTSHDYQTLYDFMHPLWHETDGEILPREHIELLLEKYFSEAGIAHYRAQGYVYQKIDDIGVLVFVERESLCIYAVHGQTAFGACHGAALRGMDCHNVRQAEKGKSRSATSDTDFTPPTTVIAEH